MAVPVAGMGDQGSSWLSRGVSLPDGTFLILDRDKEPGLTLAFWFLLQDRP